MKKNSKEFIINLIVIISVFTLIIGVILYPYVTADTAVISVKEKIVSVYDGKSKYLIMTDNEVFQNSDSIMRWKFNSSGIYNEIKEGRQYKVDVYGWRIPFLSMYRNIVKVTIQ